MCGDARRGIRDCRWDRQRFYSRLWPGAVLTCVWWQISTTKGTGGDVIILEEAAYVNPGFFYETVAPLLSMGCVCVRGACVRGACVRGACVRGAGYFVSL